MMEFYFAIGFYWPSGQIGFYTFNGTEIFFGTEHDAKASLAQASFHGDKEYFIFQIDLNQYKVIDKPKREVSLIDFGYAPGGYFNHCCRCGVEFIGDKRAQTCIPCAEKNMKEYLEE